MKIGYVKQTFKLLISTQLELLKLENCEDVIIVPTFEFNYLKTKLEKLNENDEIVVVKLFSLANNVQELLEVLRIIEIKKVKLKILINCLQIDKPLTLVELVDLIDEFVKDVKKQKQLLGIIRAKAKGKQLGRPRKMNEAKISKAINLREYYTNEKVAKMLRVSKSTLLRNIAQSKKAG